MVVAHLADIQRMACLAINGASPRAPGTALDRCLNLALLDIVIRAMARRSAYCLQQMGLWSGCSGMIGQREGNLFHQRSLNGSQTQSVVPMGLYPTVFQAEVAAIMECACGIFVCDIGARRLIFSQTVRRRWTLA
ncbi:hypothetical protein J6590_074875 [Homalodisca vitripennis]|nr:hypothetical protein J6590_074875 [Homalodisca vitripennis]